MSCGCSKKRTQKISKANTKRNKITKSSQDLKADARSNRIKKRMISIKAMTNSTFSKKD